MTFISYAQNQEDVMISRALKDIKKGFYIDVGAQDPIVDSITRAFYERGWRGINIEPSEKYYSMLVEDRPEDINLKMAVGSEIGEVTFYEFPDTGLSTTKTEYFSKHIEAGFKVCERTIPCTTLDTICREHQVGEVHFLKIDVEGAEREVLQGFSFSYIRPWIAVIEATAPMSTQDISSDWEALILEKSYNFVYFDGLNRYYIADEHKELAEHFDKPPNCFDDYITYPLRFHQEKLAELSEQLRFHQEKLAELSEQLQMLLDSYSWRLTAPLRFAKQELFSMMQVRFRVAHRARGLLQRVIIKIFRLLFSGALRFVWLRKTLRPLANLFPRFKERVLRTGCIGAAPFHSTDQFFDAMSNDMLEKQLPKTARHIYFALKRQCNLKK